MSLGKEVLVVVVVGSGQGVRNRRTRASGDRVWSHGPRDNNSKSDTDSDKASVQVRCINAKRLRQMIRYVRENKNPDLLLLPTTRNPVPSLCASP